MTTNNRQGDGLVEQKFTTPAGFVRASAYLQHKASTNKKSGKNNRTTVTLRLDGSAAYPNETIITTFLSLIQDPTAAFQTMNWTTPVTLRPGTSYLFRLYWDIKTNGALGFYFDNVKLNISPSGLRTDDNGTDVFLSWNPSVGAVALKEYRVFQATTSGGPYTQIATTTATTYTDAGMVSDNIYYYVVQDVELVSGDVSPNSVEAVFFKIKARDGPSQDIAYSWLTDRVEANWDHPKASLLRYKVAVGTTPGGNDVKDWTDVGMANTVTFTGLNLASGTTYYTTVQSQDAREIDQGKGSSNGFMIRTDPVFVDTASSTFFNNSRLQTMIDFTTDPGSIRPKTFASGGFWPRRVPVTVREPGITDRINAPCRITFNIPAGAPAALAEIRVADDQGNEVPRVVGGTLANPVVTFLVNMPKSDSRIYYVYWGNTGAPEPAYGFSNGVTQTAALQYSQYYSRKLLAAGIESVPLAFNYGYRESPAVISGDPDPGNTAPESWAEEFEYFNAAGGYANSAGWRNDCRGQQITNLFGGTFWFFGTNTPNWWIWSNGLLYNTTANANNWSSFTGATVQSFATFTGSGRWQGGLIAPLWVDLTYNDDTVIDTPGVYRDAYANREVFTWRSSMNADPTDDTYVFQTILYQTGDIAHRYDYLSPSSVTTANASGHPILNDINAVGISANNGTSYLTNTPLELGLGQTPSSFFQCDRAFDGYYTIGTIENPVGGWSNVADFDSKVFDSRLETPDWVQLEYDCTGDATGRLLFYVRTGNTALPELGGWNSWVNIATATSAGLAMIPSSDLRYCQYKVVFQRSSAGAMPVLSEVRLICGGLSIESVTTDTPDGVCQGQTGIPVGVTLKNTYINPVSLTNATLSFSLGSYTFTLVSPTLPATINPGVATAATFTVSVADASPVGMAVIQAQATGTSGPSTFFDRDAQIPGSWLVRKKATMVIKEVRTVPTAVNKGQNGIPVYIDLENTGETPLVFNGASLTFSLGFYTQTLISPVLGTVIPGPGSLTVQISVNVLSNSPSGISTIDATASGTNAFSGKPANAAGAVVKDAWTIQSPSDLVLVSITASSTVYRGQTGIPVFLNVQNIKEAPASWTSSTLLPYFTLGTYDAVYPVTPFPVTVLGGQSLTVQYGVDISPLSATGTSSVDARIDWLDGNMGDAKFYERALLPATWTIMAEVVKSYKDAAGLYPSTSFNRPSVGSTMIYAKGENLAPFKDFVVRWYNASGTEVASSNPPLTALASGTLAHQYAIDSTSPFGQWTIRITNPLDTIVSCQTSFEVVDGASLTASLSLPLTVSVGQPFQAVMSCSNLGGARTRDAYPGVLATSGTGIATLTAGPIPDSQDILGYTSATFTWMWRATGAGTFVASDVAFGVDANADIAIRSATATSNICVIQTPPSLSLLSLTATPTLVFRNQKNIEVEARVRNSGQATAVLTTASLSFTLGSYTQAIATPSALPASIPGNNTVATITFMVDVDFDSPEGLATLTFGMRAYDANVPASVTVLAPASPNDRWTIGSIGIQLSRETDFSTEQYAFNRGQDVKIRAFGLPPYSTGYRFRLYSSTIPNTSPAPAGWTDVSNRLTATSKGWVDYVYTLPAGAALTRWSVEIETDPDSNSTTLDQLLAVNYFDVQTPGNLIASLTISPSPVFVDDIVTVTLVASNTTPSGASVSPATPSALVPTAASTGALSYQTGPAPASSTVSALASATFVWTYKATDDTGTVGSYSLTAQLPCSVYGVDANTGAPINSLAAVSNSLKIYRRAMALSQAAFDLGSFAPGESTLTTPFQVGNVGNLVLSAVKWNKVDLNGVFPLSISHAYVTLAPSPVGTINPDASAAVSISMTIPYNQASGTYATTMAVYEDMNGNGNPDSFEPYKIFTVTVNVLSRPKVFVVEDLIDLGNWSPGQPTTAKTVNLFNGGNQAVTNVKFVQTVGSATFLAVSPNPGNLSIGESRVASASATIPAAATQGVYIATWTMWADTDGDGSIDGGEASDTFQVRVGVGTKQFTLSPPVLSAGIGTPSTIISGLKETVTNTGSLSLTNLKASLQPLQDGMGNSIATDHISIIPPASVVTTGTATVALFVPPGLIMGAYSGVQTLYEDSNGNGVVDPGEASETFTLSVSIPAFPAVQVLAPTVELGDLAPGADVTVPFACRNSGNVTLSRLMWTKLPLVSAGGNTISTPSYDFPPGVPFTAAPGAIFTRDVRLIVNVAQPRGIIPAARHGCSMTPIWGSIVTPASPNPRSSSSAGSALRLWTSKTCRMPRAARPPPTRPKRRSSSATPAR